MRGRKGILFTPYDDIFRRGSPVTWSLLASAPFVELSGACEAKLESAVRKENEPEEGEWRTVERERTARGVEGTGTGG